MFRLAATPPMTQVTRAREVTERPLKNMVAFASYARVGINIHDILLL